jgi:hypothetical protein
MKSKKIQNVHESIEIRIEDYMRFCGEISRRLKAGDEELDLLDKIEIFDSLVKLVDAFAYLESAFLDFNGIERLPEQYLSLNEFEVAIIDKKSSLEN